ncbi:restriction endonuclease subunit S [Leuconostoc pseudomesenteroides]|uniref:restriction endonuclease subunit S n=1 Tax=Leuconostoc pseudomesenteroides TaxID=33968 RepID=UPI0021A4214C|nr:restriction endonuclease subunit S [Leuconostoc pseudomesenteroides]MCT4412337.1 restriction endonuclease subunit M [Leuconostoc pseudomesenteroides]
MNVEKRVRAEFPDIVDADFFISELFTKLKHKRLAYKAGDLPKKPSGLNTLPALTAGILNQGLNNYVPENGATVFRNVISVSANGANTGAMFYQTKPFTVLQDSYVIDLIDNSAHSDMVYLYLVASLQKSIRFNFSWTNKAGWERIKDKRITLPVNAKGQIIFEYMELYIKELEAERIKDLEAYLVTTELNDYNLTDKELKMIKDVNNDRFKWSEFKIIDLFNIFNTHTILKKEAIPNSGFVPYVTAAESNNGISTFISQDMDKIEKGNSIMIAGKTMVITYQKNDYFSNDSHNLSLQLKEENMQNRAVQLYLVTALKKALVDKYEWGNSISREKIQSDFISLPVLEDGTPNYSMMAEYTKAIEKLVIKGVVDWKDKQIERTKNVI